MSVARKTIRQALKSLKDGNAKPLAMLAENSANLKEALNGRKKRTAKKKLSYINTHFAQKCIDIGRNKIA
jgi:hypothetical protein